MICTLAVWTKAHIRRLHDNKIIIRKFRQGMDFLGYVVLPYYRVLRTKTKRRILRKIIKKQQDFLSGLIPEKSFDQSWQSYLGVLTHCCGCGVRREIAVASGILRRA